MTLSTDERRALGIIAGLLVAASAARWLERPRPLLEDVQALDVAALEQASRDAKPDRAATRNAANAATPKRPPRETSDRRTRTTPARGTSTASAPTPAPRPARAPPNAVDPPLSRIDPNMATVEELDRLPGIGPSLAARIIEERSRGRFRTVEDLMRVRGIGATLANTLAGHLSLPAGPMRSNASSARGLTPVQTAPAGTPAGTRRESSDINYISSADLQKVQGVGPVLAARLIARRDSLRRFTSWDQVDEVAGVGPAMLSRLRESLVLRR